MPQIIWDSTTNGYTAFVGDRDIVGDRKVCNLTTRHDQGLVKSGQIIFEPMPRASWSLHFTASSMPVELIEAVMASLPTTA